VVGRVVGRVVSKRGMGLGVVSKRGMGQQTGVVSKSVITVKF
jgi:hypothetical protein